MTNKSVRKLQEYLFKTESSSYKDIYMLHWLTPNDNEYWTIDSIEWIDDESGYLFRFKECHSSPLFSEEIDENDIFIYKTVNWK